MKHKEIDYSVIDEKVMVNGVIIPLILYAVGGVWYGLAYLVFAFIIYMFVIRYFHISEELKRYKQISYLRVILYFYTPTTIFLFALMFKI